MPPTTQLTINCHLTVTGCEGINYATFRGGTRDSTTHTLTASRGQALANGVDLMPCRLSLPDTATIVPTSFARDRLAKPADAPETGITGPERFAFQGTHAVTR